MEDRPTQPHAARGNRRRLAVVLAWSIFAGVVIASIATAFAFDDPTRNQIVEHATWALILTAFTFVGAFIVQRQTASAMGWLLLLPGVAALEPALARGLDSAPADPTFTTFVGIWLSNFSWLLAIFPIILLLALFPTGRAINHRWRWHTRVVLGMAALLVGWGTFVTEVGPLEGTWTVRNPIGFLPPPEAAPWFMPLWTIGLIGITLGAAASMFLRYRRAGPVERRQLTWLLYAVSIFATVYIGIVPLHEHVSTVVVDIAFAGSLAFIPIAMMIAILRYRLFDIDVIVPRTVVYAIVAGLLAATYVGSVVTFEAIVRDLTGVDSSVGVAASTLLVAVLFNPLRRWTQSLVARRFFRTQRDVRRLVDDYGGSLRRYTDVPTLSESLLTVVDTAWHPRVVGLWLRTASNEPAELRSSRSAPGVGHLDELSS